MQVRKMMLKLLLIVITVEIAAASSDEGVCQALTDDSPSLERWMCGFVNWIRSSDEWKKLLKSKCDDKWLDLRWDKSFYCPNGPSNPKDCVSTSDYTCENLYDGLCPPCYCKEGRYKEWETLHQLFFQGKKNFEQRWRLYKSNLKKCERLLKRKATTTTTTTTAATTTTTEEPTTTTPEPPKPDYCQAACNDVINGTVPNQPVGFATSGTVAAINKGSEDEVKVYCDCTNGSAWTVFQRRMDGSVNFYQDAKAYSDGFGNLSGEFWLGLDNLHALTDLSQGNFQLRVDLRSWDNETAYAEYSHFGVDAEHDYMLRVGGYSGNASDSLTAHNYRSFTTHDVDYDDLEYNEYGYYGDEEYESTNCAIKYEGGWWFMGCLRSHLNGIYYKLGESPEFHGIMWFDWKGKDHSLKAAEMKFRRVT